MDDFEKCPICMEIPEKEIYQCVGGHTICHLCVAKLTLCPQCREPYSRKKIRNRALEQVLDLQTFDCIHAKGGCKVKLRRQDISKHAKICKKKLLPLCKALGYRTCNFVANQTAPKRILRHMMEKHAAVCENTNGICVWFTDFQSAIKSSTDTKWDPVLLTLNTEWCKDSCFMIFGSVDFRRKSASWTCFQVYGSSGNREEMYEARFSLLEGEEKKPVFICTIPVHNLQGPVSEDVIKNSSIEIQLSLIKNVYKDLSNIAISVEVQPFNQNNRLEQSITNAIEVWTFSPELERMNENSISSTNIITLPTQIEQIKLFLRDFVIIMVLSVFLLKLFIYVIQSN